MSADAAGAAATPAGQGPAGAGAQPPAGGQGGAPGPGTAPQGSESSFNWDLFPNVPEAQRSLLEPHLRSVQGHVTQLEQQYSPYKTFIDSVQPDQIDPLLGFLDNWANNPMDTVMGMLQSLQSEGKIPASVGMEAVQALLRGEQPGVQGQQQPPEQQGEQIPQWAQQMMQRFETMDQQEAARQQQEAEVKQDQALQGAMSEIRTQLDQAGIPAEIVDDTMITSAIIAHNGDPLAAAKALQDMRDRLLGNFTNGRTGAQPPAVNGQLPQTPKGSGRPAARGEKGWKAANQGAEQFLRQQNQMAGT